LDALKEAHRNASASDYREHVPRYIRVSDAFSKKGLNLEHDYSWIRITVDYEDDFELMKVLIDDFSAHTKDWKQIVQIFEDNPELLKINESRNDNLGE
jgi:spore coat polysaccharide biosynthesis protein SpsF